MHELPWVSEDQLILLLAFENLPLRSYKDSALNGSIDSYNIQHDMLKE